MVQSEGTAGIDFSHYIAEHTHGFTGRAWVFRAIDKWLAAPDGSPFFLLTGEPGGGKTAIAGRLWEFAKGTVPALQDLPRLVPGFLSAAHFCSARDRRWINPHAFAESLALQLSRRYPAYAHALVEKSGDRQIRIEVNQRVNENSGEVVGINIQRLDLTGIAPEDAYLRIVREPLEALLREGVEGPVVLLVDACDEALRYTGERL